VNNRRFDLIVVGSGIAGLAHAWLAAKSGMRVLVLERSSRAAGASVANFGMLWPIGQPAGPMLQLALASRALWLEVLGEAGLPFRATGSLHAVCREDEARVAREFAHLAPPLGYRCAWLDRDEALRRSPALHPDTVLGALWSETEIMIDPRLTLARLPEYLDRQMDVRFEWACPVHRIAGGAVHSARGTWSADRVIVCSGSDFESLYPELLAASGMIRCRLQMMRTVPQPSEWDLGPAVAGGLTLRFYPSFKICPSLPALRERIAAELPEYDRCGVHTMASQMPSGEVTLGDSHEYSMADSIFSQEAIDELILSHLRTWLRLPRFQVAERWYGVYAKHLNQPLIRLAPEPGVEIVTGFGGAGMTLSFGAAAQTFGQIPGEEIPA
jgi:FAD dependent oxidoreductase TIGR03364